MGKNFCKVEGKWCKLLRRGVCGENKTDLDQVNRCPRLAKIETKRLADLLKEVSFDAVFYKLCHWFNDQEGSRNGYESVFNKLILMSPKKHKLDDLFIEVRIVKETDGNDWLNVSGVNVLGKSTAKYGIEFNPWRDWVSSFITQKTLDTLDKEDIVAACLYEMTFFGFEEQRVQDEKNKIFNSIEECKKAVKDGKI